MRVSFLAAALAALCLTGCASAPRDAAPRSSDFPIQGIDVSKYQGTIDWQAVKQGGVEFAYIKATEGGDHLDGAFWRNWNASKAAGVPRGAYHFAYWCRPAAEQAAWFAANVPKDPDALPPVLDLEWNGDSRTCPHKLPREQARTEVRKMLAGMEKAFGRRPIIYTSVDFHRDVLEGDFRDYKIWVRSVKSHPSVKYGARRWHFWQHTAEGHVPGIKGFVDRNVFAGSAKEWQAFLEETRRPGLLTDPTATATITVAQVRPQPLPETPGPLALAATSPLPINILASRAVNSADTQLLAAQPQAADLTPPANADGDD